MNIKTCLIQPGRVGDIISVLPIARDIALKEGTCAFMVSAEFASVLEGCSYVTPIVLSSHFTDIQPAIEQARGMFERVLVAKVSEKSVGVTTQCQSFNEEQWRQCGALNDWFRLPLVFDRRDRDREGKWIRLAGRRTDGRQKVLVNFSGKSAPFPHASEVLDRISKVYNVVDLASFKAHRIYDLIGLMDSAVLLITGDTATMHLAAASGIPVVNLIGDKPTPWHGSRPRNNNVLSIRYSDVHRLSEIATVELRWKPRTWHVWSDYPMTGDTLRRHKLAALTWKDTGWIDFPVKETRRVIQDPMRSVPFIKDLVNEAVRAAGPRDVIVLTNADTCVAQEAGKITLEVSAGTCLYSYRRDFPALNRGLTREDIRHGRHYVGCDLFAFTVQWWENYAGELPDLVLGAECWDWCLRLLMRKTGGAEFDDLIAHEAHPNLWEREDHRHSLPSQRHNQALAAPFIAAYADRL